MYICVNSTIQRCPNKIIKIYLIEDFSYLPPVSTTPVLEIIDTVFAKTSSKRSASMTEYERIGLVFTKTRVYKFGHSSQP
jgi:hypothetical protein